MEAKKRNVFLPVVILFLILNIPVFGQARATNKQTKAEYVLELLRTTSVKSIYIIATNYHKEYKEEWLANVSVRDNLIIFKSGHKIDSWDIKDAIFIEKYRDVIKVKLKDEIAK